MLEAQWRLTVVTFVSVPVTIVIMKVCTGGPCQSLMLGEGVCDGSVTTGQPWRMCRQVYGGYYRKLSKKVQEVLAEANVVADECLSTMTTVKAHAAEASAEHDYGERLRAFTHLQLKEAAAYGLYAFTTILMPNAVAALSLFYVRRPGAPDFVVECLHREPLCDDSTTVYFLRRAVFWCCATACLRGRSFHLCSISRASVPASMRWATASPA